MATLPRIFDYLDYRAYLRRYYAVKKSAGRGFSFRAFSRRAGLKAPNHLKRVMEGERNLSPETAAKYAEALQLTGDEAAYFVDLVTFNQARSHAERSAAYQRLTGFRGYRKAHKLELAHAAYHSEWFIPAIREMVARPDFRPEAAWIAPRMRPRITQQDASRALDVLFDLGLLEHQGEKVAMGEPVASTGPETTGMHIGAYHRAMLDRAAASIDEIPALERDISSLTLCVGENGLQLIKRRIQELRKELIAMAITEDEGDQVIQVGFQLFPLTTSRSDEEGPA
ncbi:MAG: TIGR02147 family protein [Myxococcota bacterium]